MEALLLLANAASSSENVAGLRTTRSIAQRAAASLQRGEVFVQPHWLSSVQPARQAAALCARQRLCMRATRRWRRRREDLRSYQGGAATTRQREQVARKAA